MNSFLQANSKGRVPVLPHKRFVSRVSGVLLWTILLTSQGIGAIRTWTNSVGDLKWSTGGNWNGGVPGVNDIANFDSTATGTNIVDSNMIVDQLYYGQTAGTMAFETQIGGGIVLTNVQRIYVSYNNSGLSPTCRVDVTGGGTFKAGNYMMMIGGREPSGGTPNATLTFDGVAFVIDSLGYFYLGYANHWGGGPAFGTLDLSRAASVRSGSKPNCLTVDNDLWIGGNYGYGALRLPPSVTNITCGNLNMGTSLYGGATPYSVLDLGTNPALTRLTVANDVTISKARIIYHDGSMGKTGFPPNVSIKIGSSGAPANLYFATVFGMNTDIRWGGFRRFDAWLKRIYLGYTSNSGTTYGELDLANTNTVELAGSFANDTMVVDDVRLGGVDASGTGRLKLPPSITNITVGTLYLGVMGNLSQPAYSAIDLGTNSLLRELTIRDAFQMGRGYFQYANGGGTVIGTPPGLRVNIGSASAPGALFYIGNAIGQGSESRFGRGVTDFRAYVTNANVAKGYGGNHWSIGELDLRSATNLILEVSQNFQISAASEAYGYAYLFGGVAGGHGCASNVYISNASHAWNAVLVLSNMQFAVSNQVVFGYNSKMTNFIDGVASGFDMASTNLVFGANSGNMHLVFLSDQPDQTVAYWGLRMGGDAVAPLNALTTTPARITYDISALSARARSRFGVYYDYRRDQTLIGFPALIQGTVFLVL